MTAGELEGGLGEQDVLFNDDVDAANTDTSGISIFTLGRQLGLGRRKRAIATQMILVTTMPALVYYEPVGQDAVCRVQHRTPADTVPVNGPWSCDVYNHGPRPHGGVECPHRQTGHHVRDHPPASAAVDASSGRAYGSRCSCSDDGAYVGRGGSSLDHGWAPPVGYVYVGTNQGLSIWGHNEIVVASIMEGGEVGNSGCV